MIKPTSSVVALSFCVCPVQAQTKDATGCKDSTLVGRYPGTFIKSCIDKSDDSHDFEMGDGKQPKRLEGEFHEISYSAPQGASKAQIIRNLRTALRMVKIVSVRVGMGRSCTLAKEGGHTEFQTPTH